MLEQYPRSKLEQHCLTHKGTVSSCDWKYMTNFLCGFDLCTVLTDCQAVKAVYLSANGECMHLSHLENKHYYLVTTMLYLCEIGNA